MSHESRVRTRIAPSPTGYLHIGSVQKMLYSYAHAKKMGGDYILRVEDTDRSRYVEDAEAEFYKVHEILGLKLDESPKAGGKYAPYRQSERLDLYKKYAEELVDKGHAYYAFETPEELTAMREAMQAEGKQPRYRGIYRDMKKADVVDKLEAGEKYVIRIKLPENQTVTVDDMIMGKIEFNTKDLDDYILLKSDGFPTYHLAVVVDDHLMEISHVYRGVEWIATSPIHVLLYEFFGWEKPAFGHIPNLLDPKGGKLSKRSGSVAVMDYFKKGYLAEAIINYMMLMAWSPKSDRELFTLEEFVEIFTPENFNKSNPVFDVIKINWFNQQYIRKMSPAELLKRFYSWADDFATDDEQIAKFKHLNTAQQEMAISLERERITLLGDLVDKLGIFTGAPATFEFDHKQTAKIANSLKVEILNRYKEILENKTGDWSHEIWESGIRKIAEDLNLQAGGVFMTIRIAVTGKAATPPLFEFGEVIGQQEELIRIDNAISFLS